MGYALVKNHAFIDGNKRIGVYAMLIFLDVNGIRMSYSDNDIITLGLGIADGSLNYKDVLTWVNRHKDAAK
ncbi:MAG: type II toxin-antitoxin system death-on-curing family toxin [Ruthenibacterium lactatiformans]